MVISKVMLQNWLGQSIDSGDGEFRVPEHYVIYSASKRVDENGVQYVRVSGVRWFTKWFKRANINNIIK